MPALLIRQTSEMRAYAADRKMPIVAVLGLLGEIHDNKPILYQMNPPVPTRPPLLPKLKCLLGRHAWVSDYESVLSTDHDRHVTIIWWTCEECGKTKVKHISR